MPYLASRRVGAVMIAAGLVGFGCDNGAAPDAPPVQVYDAAPCAEFFPGATFMELPDRTDLWKVGFEASLRAFGEPCFPPAGPGPDEAYRFLWTRTFDPHLVVRLERWGERLYVVTKVLGGRFDRLNVPGNPSVVFGPIEVDREAKRRFDEVLEFSDFWLLTARPQGRDALGGVDGAEWVLEGWRDGRYHVVSAWCPAHGGPYVRFADACMELVRLAGVQIDDERVY